MKLGIISDTHDRVERVVTALDLFRSKGVDRLIHCGDVTSAQTVELFQGWTVDFVLGNCDWNPVELESAMKKIGATLHRPFGELDLGSLKIAWIHSDDAQLFQSLENANHWDYLFY